MRALLALLFFVPSFAFAVTLDDLYRQSGIERLPARLPQAVTRSGSLVGLSRAAVGGPIGVAVGIGLAYVQYSADQAEALRIQLGAKNGKSLPTPDGYRDPDTPLTPNAGSGTLYRYTHQGQTREGFRTLDEAGVAACESYSPNVPSGYTFRGYSSVSNNTAMCDAVYDLSGALTVLSSGIAIQSYPSPFCQTGYTYDQSTNLCNPGLEKQKWPQDGVATLKPVPNSWENHSRESDTVTDLGAQPSILINGLDANGNPTLHTVTANPDGSVTVNIKTQIPNSTTNGSDVDSLSFTTNSYGDVVSVQNNTYYNTTIDQVSTAPLRPQPTTKIDFPNDYSRETTTQQTRDAVRETRDEVKKTNTLIDDLTGLVKKTSDYFLQPVPTTVPAVDPIPTDTVDLSTSLDSGRFNLPGTCPLISGFTVMGTAYNLDLIPMCNLADMLRPLLLALAGLVAFRLLTS